jgi:hypothetical protein
MRLLRYPGHEQLLFLPIRIGVLLTALLLFTPLTPSISATPLKARAACSKAGVSKNYNGKKYTCVKSGKKLVWNKGVIIKVQAKTLSPAPSPTPTSEPSPTPAPTPTPTPTPNADLGPKIGSSCKNQGESVSSPGLILVCRLVANYEKKFFELSDSFTPEINPKSPDSLATCRLRDQRSKPIQPEGTQIAYPITPRFGSVKSGIQKIAVVGFDFEDSPGSGSPLDIFGSDLQKSQDFFQWYSNGKVRFEFTTHNQWIRLKNPTNSYQTDEHFGSVPGSLKVEEMAQEFHAAISKHMNLNGFSSVWFTYPRDVKNLNYNFGFAGGWNGFPSFYASGPGYRQIALPLWTFFIHEMLHEQGLSGHSPKAPWRLGVLLNGNGYSAAINSWDELSVDWMLEEEIYCIDRKNLATVQINLAPIERKQSGVHSIMIKLDDQRILVIESHRKGEFSPGMPDYGYGVTLQLTDMTKITTWDDERATSVYLKVTNQNRFGPEYGERINNPWANDSGINLFNGIGVSGARWGIDQSYLLLEGESFVFEGITIEFKKSGNTDAISLKP